MKKDIHPNYHTDAAITCACGTVYTIGSTKPTIAIELCSQCHPFYTGKQKILDTARRVEKFQAREDQKQEATDHAAKVAKKAARAKQKADKKAKAEA